VSPSLRPESRVPLDKNKGVVKRHGCAAVLFCTAPLPEWLRTEALEISR
jgi:hypothetical protein